MPFPNFHAARIKNPNLFARIRVLKTLNNGIMIYGGTLKVSPGGDSEAQSYRFPITNFTVDQAKEWLKEHDINYIMFEKATNTVTAFSETIKVNCSGLKNARSSSIRLLSSILSFKQNEIIVNIPHNILNKIKEKDSHPFFTMYSICHEGKSSPVIIGEGQKEISWPKKAIQSIKNIITKGLKLFKGHNKDGSHSGRRVIGKVIHSFEKEINGILHHLIIAYHKPENVEEIKKYDVCSQEAKWNILDIAGNLVADTIDKLTGIALGNSKNNIPAFSGAKRLGYVHAFKSTGNVDNINIGAKEMAKQTQVIDELNQSYDGNQNDDLNQINQEAQQTQQTRQNQFNDFQRQQNGNQNIRQMALTFAELKEEIKRMKVFPSQIFDMEDIKRDRAFAGIFNELEILKDEKEKMEAKLNELQRTAALSTAGDRIENHIKENKIPVRIADFVRKRFDKIKDSINDLSDKGIADFVEDQTTLFQDTAITIDPEFDIKKTSGDNNVEGDDYTKAENNELLEEDLDI